MRLDDAERGRRSINREIAGNSAVNPQPALLATAPFRGKSAFGRFTLLRYDLQRASANG